MNSAGSDNPSKLVLWGLSPSVSEIKEKHSIQYSELSGEQVYYMVCIKKKHPIECLCCICSSGATEGLQLFDGERKNEKAVTVSRHSDADGMKRGTETAITE